MEFIPEYGSDKQAFLLLRTISPVPQSSQNRLISTEQDLKLIQVQSPSLRTVPDKTPNQTARTASKEKGTQGISNINSVNRNLSHLPLSWGTLISNPFTATVGRAYVAWRAVGSLNGRGLFASTLTCSKSDFCLPG